MSCSGNPTTYTSGTPADVSDLRAQLVKLISGGLTTGASAYNGPLATKTNPLMLGAANLLSNMMGYGNYQQPGYWGVSGTGTTGTTGAGTGATDSTGNSSANYNGTNPALTGTNFTPTTGYESDSSAKRKRTPLSFT